MRHTIRAQYLVYMIKDQFIPFSLFDATWLWFAQKCETEWSVQKSKIKILWSLGTGPDRNIVLFPVVEGRTRARRTSGIRNCFDQSFCLYLCVFGVTGSSHLLLYEFSVPVARLCVFPKPSTALIAKSPNVKANGQWPSRLVTKTWWVTTHP